MNQIINDTYCRECGCAFDIEDALESAAEPSVALCIQCGSDDLEDIDFDDDGGMDTNEAKANGFHALY